MRPWCRGPWAVTLAKGGHIAEVSPDGSLIAFHAPSPKGETLSVASAIDGSGARAIADFGPRHFRWLPAGRALVAIVDEGDTDNLWELPLDGSPRRQLTTFTEDGIFRFDISRDGRYVLSRGRSMRDAVLMELTQEGRSRFARGGGAARRRATFMIAVELRRRVLRLKMELLVPSIMATDDRFERVRALLRQLQSRLPRLSDASLAANATLDHALELVRRYEREWLLQNPVDVRITYWRRRAEGEEMLTAMESAALQRVDDNSAERE